MGALTSSTSRIPSSLTTTKTPMKLVMLGLDNAGKTTILYQLKLPAEIITTIPTFAFNVETVTHAQMELTAWDVGGRCESRPLWRTQYFSRMTGIIFVVDSSDPSVLDQPRDSDNVSAKEELAKIMAEDTLRNAPLLVYANKQDLPKAISVEEVTERLGLKALRNREWHIQGVSARENPAALYQGLEWMVKVHEKRSEMNKSGEQQHASPSNASSSTTSNLASSSIPSTTEANIPSATKHEPSVTTSSLSEPNRLEDAV